jgi:ubiquinone/menaquinone biosynthesis C-methylase UbiE
LLDTTINGEEGSVGKYVEVHDRVSGLIAYLENRAFSSYWHARSPHVLDALSITRADDCLEIGSGARSWTSYLAPRVGSMTALEPDGKLIEHARLWRSPTSPVRPTEGVQFVQGDAQAMPFADDSFDAALMIDVIEHIPDDRRAIAEVARVLRPGGRFVLTTIREDRRPVVRKISWEHEREYNLDRLTELVESAGLDVARAFDFYHTPLMASREIYVWLENTRWFRTWPTRMVLGALLSPLALVERFAPFGTPRGVGLLAIARG